MYNKVTRNIEITVTPVYLEGQSDPMGSHYVWAYTINIKNNGDNRVQLINRFWHITDATGAVQEVRGAGVVGEQPVLNSRDTYQYTSGAALRTPSGIMKGHYEMENELQERFLVDIPAFSLDSPAQRKRPN